MEGVHMYGTREQELKIELPKLQAREAVLDLVMQSDLQNGGRFPRMKLIVGDKWTCRTEPTSSMMTI